MLCHLLPGSYWIAKPKLQGPDPPLFYATGEDDLAVIAQHYDVPVLSVRWAQQASSLVFSQCRRGRATNKAAQEGLGRGMLSVRWGQACPPAVDGCRGPCKLLGGFG